MKKSRQLKGGAAPFLAPQAVYLRRRRRLAEITTTELARVTGLSTAFLSLVELGKRRLFPHRYEQLLKAIEYLEAERRREGATLPATLLPPPPPSPLTPPADQTQPASAPDQTAP